MKFLYKIPDEIYRNIYKYLNPISIPYKKKLSKVWCSKCGEILKDGDWFLSLGDDDQFILYECKLCMYENIYYDFDIWDTLLLQEMAVE